MSFCLLHIPSFAVSTRSLDGPHFAGSLDSAFDALLRFLVSTRATFGTISHQARLRQIDVLCTYTFAW